MGIHSTCVCLRISVFVALMGPPHSLWLRHSLSPHTHCSSFQGNRGFRMRTALPSLYVAGHGRVLVQALGGQGEEGRPFQDATIVGSACPRSNPTATRWPRVEATQGRSRRGSCSVLPALCTSGLQGRGELLSYLDRCYWRISAPCNQTQV